MFQQLEIWEFLGIENPNKKIILPEPYKFEKPDHIISLEKDVGEKSPKYVIKLKQGVDHLNRRYHIAFYCGGYWHSYRGENYFHEQLEDYKLLDIPENELKELKRIFGSCEMVPCMYLDTCKYGEGNCRCCWCGGDFKNRKSLREEREEKLKNL